MRVVIIEDIPASEAKNLKLGLHRLEYSDRELAFHILPSFDNCVYTASIFIYSKDILEDRRFRELLLEYLI